MTVSYDDFKSAVAGFMQHEFRYYNGNDLPYNVMIFFRAIEAINSGYASSEDFVDIVENWINIYGNIFNKSGKDSIEDMFTPIFMSLYFKNKEFSEIYRIMGRLPFMTNEMVDELKTVYSLTYAFFKTKEASINLDMEALEFYFLNALEENKKRDPLSDSEILYKIIPVIKKERGPDILWKPFDSLSSFYTGLFEKIDFPENIDAEISEFLISTLDNFWCVIKESENDFSY